MVRRGSGLHKSATAIPNGLQYPSLTHEMRAELAPNLSPRFLEQGQQLHLSLPATHKRDLLRQLFGCPGSEQQRVVVNAEVLAMAQAMPGMHSLLSRVSSSIHCGTLSRQILHQNHSQPHVCRC